MKTVASFCLTLGTAFLTQHAFAQAPSTVTTTAVPIQTASTDVGVSSRDGITISGADVLVTRNGVTEKLTKELELPNGMRVQPNGAILMSGGDKLALRPTQVLSFEGRFINAPIIENTAPAAATTTTSATTTTTTTTASPQPGLNATPVAPVPAGTVPTVTFEKRMTPAEEAAQVEAQRRANAINKGAIKAGEGVQK